jgi:PST family polysaccharide transporter
VSDHETPRSKGFDRELSRRIVRGSAWVGLGYGGRQILAFAGTLVLVRILDPHAFGTVAVGMSLLAIVSQIQESGLGSALVYQRHRDTMEAASSVFVFAALAGFALTAVTVVLAPLYTRLLNVPEAAGFLQVLALLLTVRGLSVPAQQRRVRFCGCGRHGTLRSARPRGRRCGSFFVTDASSAAQT